MKNISRWSESFKSFRKLATVPNLRFRNFVASLLTFMARQHSTYRWAIFCLQNQDKFSQQIVSHVYMVQNCHKEHSGHHDLSTGEFKDTFYLPRVRDATVILFFLFCIALYINVSLRTRAIPERARDVFTTRRSKKSTFTLILPSTTMQCRNILHNVTLRGRSASPVRDAGEAALAVGSV